MQKLEIFYEFEEAFVSEHYLDNWHFIIVRKQFFINEYYHFDLQGATSVVCNLLLS